MKKLALLLFGLSYKKYKHFTRKQYFVNYELSIENYKKYIYEYFIKLGYSIDVFFVTNISNEQIQNEIINTYQPKKYLFTDNLDIQNVNKIPDNTFSRNLRFKQVIDLFIDYTIENNTSYDHCIITRFDLLFQKDFELSNINFDIINIVSVLEHKNVICDNFYLFPYKHINEFQKLATDNLNINYHCIENKINKIDKINFILSEYKHIINLSFYKIVRTYF